MIITKTPLRMSFFGGGTDYRSYFEDYGGSVLSTTIDKYCYVTVRRLPPFFAYKNEAVYSKIERTEHVADIEHPSVREALKLFGMEGVRVVYDADLPARSGLGSSSSFSVGLVNALRTMKGEATDKAVLANDAIYVERVLCGESGGEQDQVAVAFGGLNRINFFKDGREVIPLDISKERKEELNRHLMLFFTGMSRNSATFARLQEELTGERLQELREIRSLVDEGERILTSARDIRDFGRLLNDAWRVKRGITRRISSDFIDAMYRLALANGALGGKLLGAGGGGFFLLFVEPERRERVRSELSAMSVVPFAFEDRGADIVYCG